MRQNRQKNLCVPVGKTKNKGIAGAPSVVKLHFCCFPNILTKIIQEQGRRQLGKTFGTGDAPDCGGLSLDDMQALDFDKMDFTDFYAEIKAKMYQPSETEMREQAQNSLQYIFKGDEKNPYNPDNKYAGTIDFEKRERENKEKIAQEEALKRYQEQEQQKTVIQEKLAPLRLQQQEINQRLTAKAEKLEQLNQEQYEISKKQNNLQTEISQILDEISKKYNNPGNLAIFPESKSFLVKYKKINSLEEQKNQLQATYNERDVEFKKIKQEYLEKAQEINVLYQELGRINRAQ